MKSISSLSVMISILINDIIVNGNKCLPNGCFYDLSVDLTKKIECKSDGSLEILHFHGNNGCDNEEFYLPELIYNSPVENICCKPPVQGEPTKRINCRNDFDCNWMQYCDDFGYCANNPCPHSTFGFGDSWFCEDDGECPSNNNYDCYCAEDFNGNEHKCVPRFQQDESEELILESEELTEYTVTVKNIGSYTGGIGIFETSPSDALISGAYPIVFGTHSISDGAESSVTFEWTMDWGLSWFDGSLYPGICQPDESDSDIIYSRHGQILDVSPSDPLNNGAKYHYDQNNEVYDILPLPNSNLNGQLQVSTDDSFTVSEARDDCFNLLVTLGGDPVFVIPGEPSTIITYDINPQYYLSTVKNIKGETVSATSVSESYPIKFTTGVYDITVCLNDQLQFGPCPSSIN